MISGMYLPIELLCLSLVIIFAQELAMYLLDSDFSSREMTVTYIKELRYTLESYQTSIRDDSRDFCSMVIESNAKVTWLVAGICMKCHMAIEGCVLYANDGPLYPHDGEQDLLNRGIEEFNKGPSSYASSYDLLTRALQCSRCCGDAMVVAIT